MLVAKQRTNYTTTMIERYKTDDALNATEKFLLVPTPIRQTREISGFAGQVMDKFSIVGEMLEEKEGLEAAEVLLIGTLGEKRDVWLPRYTLALCGTHHNDSEGWANTPEYLTTGLDYIETTSSLEADIKVATASIPGTGFSGIKGDASPDAILNALEAHNLKITMYQRGSSGDREEAVYADPTRYEKVSLG